jgi:hypothetical protein
MKKHHLFTVVLSFVLALAVLPAAVQAADSFRFKGQSADASFFHADGCIQTFVGVFASEGVFHSPPGPGDGQSGTNLFIDQFDTCAGTPILSAFGSAILDDAAFQPDQKLGSATLNAAIEVFDGVSGATFTANVNLNWTGVGNISRGKSHFHSQSPGCKINSKFNGTFRQAQAVGTVTIEATNFTPDASQFAGLQSVKTGDVISGCGI